MIGDLRDQELVLFKNAYLEVTSLGCKVEKGKHMQLSLQQSPAPAVLHSTNEAFLANTDDAGLWQIVYQQRDLARLQVLSQVREPCIKQDQSWEFDMSLKTVMHLTPTLAIRIHTQQSRLWK